MSTFVNDGRSTRRAALRPHRRHAGGVEIVAAFTAGRVACQDDRPRAAGADVTILRMIDGALVGQPRTVELMQAFERGYASQVDADMLAAGLVP